MNMLLRKSRFVKKIFVAVFLSAAVTPFDLLAGTLSCDISASVAFLINAENGNVLFSRNAEEPLYPASTTKIATVIYALHRKGYALDQKVVVSPESVATVTSQVRRHSGKQPSYRLEFGGTLMGLKIGEQVDLKTLLYGLMLPSGNDAANMIAETVSGSVPQFMIELEQFLQEIGCTNTHFKNPHGLPDNGHVTTPKDLAVMMRFGMKNPVFREICGSAKYLKAETNKQPEVWLSQHNALLKPASKHFYPHATAGKIGWTVQAGHTIVVAAEKGDRSLIAVLCHKESAASRYRNVIQLFEAAFEEPKKTRTLLSGAHDLFSQKIEGAKEILKAGLVEDVVVSFYPSEEKQYHSQIRWKAQGLPIQAGALVGEILIFDERERLQQSASLFALKAVEPTLSYQVQQGMDKVRGFVHTYRIYIAYLMAFILLFGAIWKVAGGKKVKIF